MRRLCFGIATAAVLLLSCCDQSGRRACTQPILAPGSSAYLACARLKAGAVRMFVIGWPSSLWACLPLAMALSQQRIGACIFMHGSSA